MIILKHKHLKNHWYIYFIFFILFLNLKHCISFTKYQNESATFCGIHLEMPELVSVQINIIATSKVTKGLL